VTRWKTILIWTGIAIILGLVLWIIPVLQASYFPAETKPADVPMLINENRRTLAQLIGGFFLLLALYLTFRRTTALEKTVEVTEQGQITERFTRAIEQLGATDDQGRQKLEIRLGGIYALERIARDSPERDYRTIMEVLTAYVRENAPWPSEGFSKAPLAYEPTAKKQEGAEKNETPDAQSPTGDIRAILEVLRRREVERVPEAHRVPLDLRRTNLYSAILREFDLYGANLREANLREADLYRANLQRAKLSGADLRRANLQEANLRGANLYQANLYEAKLFLADLQGAELPNADLRKANLRGANLNSAILHDAHLSDANFSGANLQGANFPKADLERADFSEADLRLAPLYGANLQRANLEGANLEGAHLERANLEGAKVKEEQLAEAMSLRNAIMPDGSKHD
jgi:uncharacterized protein YjbI with pentapeptide repeats